MRSSALAITTAFLALAATAPAAEFVLTFEPPATPDADTQIYEWNEKGMDLSIAGDHMRSRDNGVHSYAPSNGTAFIAFLPDYDAVRTPATLTNSAGDSFSLKNVDLAEYSGSVSPSGIEFLGYRSDTSVVTNSFVLDGDIDGDGPTNDWETFSFSADFTNLSYVVIRIPGSTATERFSMDNLRMGVTVTRPAMLTDITSTNDTLTLTVSNLTLMSSNLVERSHDLLASNWTAAAWFVGTNTTAQWSESISNHWTNVFYRLRSR